MAPHKYNYHIISYQCNKVLLSLLLFISSELTGADLQRRLLVSVWQVADDPSLDQLVGATSFGIRNIASSKTVQLNDYIELVRLSFEIEMPSICQSRAYAILRWLVGDVPVVFITYNHWYGRSNTISWRSHRMFYVTIWSIYKRDRVVTQNHHYHQDRNLDQLPWLSSSFQVLIAKWLSQGGM